MQAADRNSDLLVYVCSIGELRGLRSGPLAVIDLSKERSAGWFFITILRFLWTIAVLDVRSVERVGRVLRLKC